MGWLVGVAIIRAPEFFSFDFCVCMCYTRLHCVIGGDLNGYCSGCCSCGFGKRIDCDG